MYRMKNCRPLLERLIDDAGNENLNHELIDKIENAVNTQSNSTFDYCYSLIDTACKTIHEERSEYDNSNDNLPKRFKNTLKILNLVPPDYDTTQPNGITTTMRGLERAIRGLCELRNSDGNVSHGKPASSKSMDLLQIQFAAQTADLVVHYLYQAHFDYPMPLPELDYLDNPDFNEWIDEQYPPIEVFGQSVLVSEILFNIDEAHITYKEVLKDYILRKAMEFENDVASLLEEITGIQSELVHESISNSDVDVKLLDENNCLVGIATCKYLEVDALVDVSHIHSLKSTKDSLNVESAYIVTTGQFDENAKELAIQFGISLISGDEFQSLVEEHGII